jgi:hypothetical protein
VIRDELAITAWLMSNAESDPFEWIADLTRRPEWHSRAACRGSGTEGFFPRKGASLTTARAACAACSVIDECLDAGLSDTDAKGIWGGTSEKQRREMRREGVSLVGRSHAPGIDSAMLG